jgi:hypothetical protein
VIPKLPTDPARRAERKADLLLASQLLRGQAVLAVDDLGERADVWGRRWQALRGWLADPLLLATGGAAAAFLAGAGRRRGPLLKGLRMALLAWRVWKEVGTRRAAPGPDAG